MGKRQQRWLLKLAVTLICVLTAVVARWGAEVELPSSERPVLLRCRQIGDDLRQELVTAVREAKESVLIAVYALTDARLISACNDVARRGVQVQIATHREHVTQLRRLLAPEVALIAPPGSGLMHRKLLVVDRRWVWVGSANFTTSSLCLHDNLTIACEAAPLAQWLWNYYQALFEERRPPPPYVARMMAGGQELQMWLMPEASALGMLIEQIDGAKRSIQLALFAWTHPKLTDALKRAARRGVRVEMVVDQAAARGSSVQAVADARKAKIPVMERGGRALCHHKLAIIDEEQLITGSANWTRSAFEKNAECVIRIAPLTDDQRQTCRALWKQLTTRNSTPATRPHWVWQDGASGGGGGAAQGPPDRSEVEPDRIAA